MAGTLREGLSRILVMTASPKPLLFSRRAALRLLAALPLLSTFSFVQRYAAADEFVEIDGWILKRSDLRQRDAR
jgi:hypothetical protein